MLDVEPCFGIYIVLGKSNTLAKNGIRRLSARLGCRGTARGGAHVVLKRINGKAIIGNAPRTNREKRA